MMDPKDVDVLQINGQDNRELWQRYGTRQFNEAMRGQTCPECGEEINLPSLRQDMSDAVDRYMRDYGKDFNFTLAKSLVSVKKGSFITFLVSLRELKNTGQDFLELPSEELEMRLRDHHIEDDVIYHDDCHQN